MNIDEELDAACKALGEAEEKIAPFLDKLSRFEGTNEELEELITFGEFARGKVVRFRQSLEAYVRDHPQDPEIVAHQEIIDKIDERVNSLTTQLVVLRGYLMVHEERSQVKIIVNRGLDFFTPGELAFIQLIVDLFENQFGTKLVEHTFSKTPIKIGDIIHLRAKIVDFDANPHGVSVRVEIPGGENGETKEVTR